MMLWPFAFLRPNSGSSFVREERTTSRQISVPLLSWSWPLISRPALYNHWKAEVIIIAHPILCVCLLTVRSLAGLIAVGSVKRQLFVSAFHENLWLNLSRAWSDSALLLLIISARTIPLKLDLFECVNFMPEEPVPAKDYQHDSFQRQQKYSHQQFMHFNHSELLCF